MRSRHALVGVLIVGLAVALVPTGSGVRSRPARAVASLGPEVVAPSTPSDPSEAPSRSMAREDRTAPAAPRPAADKPAVEEPAPQRADDGPDLRPAAVALSAARPNRKVYPTERRIRRAAASIGIAAGDRPLDREQLDRIERRAWNHARRAMTVAGITWGQDGRDAKDLRRAARRLGVRLDGHLMPKDVRRIMAAGRRHIKSQLRRGHVGVGKRLDLRDLRRAARRFDARHGERLFPIGAQRIAHVTAKRGRARWEAKHPTPVFARVAGVRLRFPEHRPRYAGFHQAAYPDARQMNRKGKGHTHVLPSRHRGTGRRTAVDIVMAPGRDVRSPVTGRVVEVSPYALYGRYRDVRITIRPSGNRRVLTKVLHVKGPRVRTGQRVRAGRTVIATSVRKFPFSSQVDWFSGKRWGHVHIEVGS